MYLFRITDGSVEKYFDKLLRQICCFRKLVGAIFEKMFLFRREIIFLKKIY